MISPACVSSPSVFKKAKSVLNSWTDSLQASQMLVLEKNVCVYFPKEGFYHLSWTWLIPCGRPVRHNFGFLWVLIYITFRESNSHTVAVPSTDQSLGKWVLNKCGDIYDMRWSRSHILEWEAGKALDKQRTGRNNKRSFNNS